MKLLLATAATLVVHTQTVELTHAQSDGRSDGPRALMGRLLAPCCWRQTLDIHDSDEAAELRREIYASIQQGDSAAMLEARLVERYGERIRALPGHTDPSGVLPVFVGAIMMGCLVGVIAWVRLRRRDDGVMSVIGSGESVREALVGYDLRLDEELARIDRLN